MSKPPKVVIPGLNRGVGIPPGYILGRRRGTGKGPAELLDLTQMKGAGLATTAQVTQVVDQLSTALSTTTAAQAGAALMMGGEGEDGASGPPGQAGPAGTAGSPGATGPAGPPGFGVDGQDGEEGMPIPGVAGRTGATGPQGPLGFAQDGEDGQDGMIIPRPRSAAVQVSVVHELPMANLVTSFYRSDTARTTWPSTSTVSGAAGATLTLSSAIAQAVFTPAHMLGVSRVRIWNTTRNLSAWVQDAPTTTTWTVTNAADIATWTAGDAITAGEPSNTGLQHVLAIDIAPMMLATLGRVFPQAGIAARAAVIPSAANSQCEIDLWRTPISGTETIIAGLATSLLMGDLQNSCTDLSPISNTNLIYVNDPVTTPVAVSLMSAFEITETITLNGEEGMPGPSGGAGPPGATGPQGPMGFAMDGEEGPEGMPIPGAPGPAGASGAGALTLISRQTLLAAAGTVSFTSIPSSYGDLLLIGQARSTIAGTSDNIICQLNGDTGANYDYDIENRNGTASGFAATSILVFSIAGNTAPANAADTFETIFTNYAATTFHKTMRGTNSLTLAASAGSMIPEKTTSRWRSTAAINRIDLISPANTFAIGSTFSLYGRG